MFILDVQIYVSLMGLRLLTAGSGAWPLDGSSLGAPRQTSVKGSRYSVRHYNPTFFNSKYVASPKSSADTFRRHFKYLFHTVLTTTLQRIRNFVPMRFVDCLFSACLIDHSRQ